MPFMILNKKYRTGFDSLASLNLDRQTDEKLEVINSMAAQLELFRSKIMSANYMYLW